MIRPLLVAMTLPSLLASSGVASDPAATAALNRLLDDAWQYTVREKPLFATSVGDHRYDDRLPRVRPVDAERHAAARREFIGRLKKIDRAALGPEDRITYDIFLRLSDDAVRDFELGDHLLAITSRDGFHVEFPDLPAHWPLETARDYENYIARLGAFGEYVDDHVILLRAGIERGWTQPEVTLRGFDKTIEPHVVANPVDSRLYDPFREFPATVPDGERERLCNAARQTIAEVVVPGFERFGQFMAKEYIPAARTSVGAAALENGREYYRHRVRHFTTLDITPAEVHQIGLAEVARIDGEMKAVVERSGFDGTVAQFVEHLRTDPKFYAQSSEELLQRTALVLKRMDGQLPRLFGRLPRMSYGIREIPDYIAPRTTTAYYSPPSGDGRRAGYYYVNTFNLPSRPLYEIEALSLHEAVPGHHLQLAIQQELTGMPPLRRFGGFTVFVEGWGLYAESLGKEVGFYADPYSEFGRLSYDAWRACRLVVDTGIHELGWTRNEAIEFMAQHTAMTRHNIETEVDRYITWPGQALAYKIGQLKIRELRREAEQRLGERFDVREFHDVVLGHGSVPLDVLERQVREYIAARSSAGN